MKPGRALRVEEKKRSLRTMPSDATKQLNIILRFTPKLKGQAEQNSMEFGLSLDTAFPVDLANDDERLGALRRVVQTLPIDQITVL